MSLPPYDFFAIFTCIDFFILLYSTKFIVKIIMRSSRIYFHTPQSIPSTGFRPR